ncbi:hypothetical protein R83H12_00257 [Fibrobacteria bacterium R8-3-H12]
MTLPAYPNFVPVSLDLQEEIQKIVLEAKSDISALTFANLYLFRNKYGFNVSLLNNSLIVAGTHKSKTFFSIVGDVPAMEILNELLKKYDYWKNVSSKQALHSPVALVEDRDNFEYLYLRTDLAELPGKNFQKKRNLVNAFIKTYSLENVEIKPIDSETIKDALLVLDEWKEGKGSHSDYEPAKEALNLHCELGLSGLVFYVSKKPVGYCQGETLAGEKSFAVHFEKALDGYKGIYQYINQEFAKSIPKSIICINREQDLGHEGLRQAKITYRPVDFVRLFSSNVSTKAE